MKTYTASFYTDAGYAVCDFEAETPEQALRKALRFVREREGELEFERYDDCPVYEIAIRHDGSDELAVWLDDDERLRLAARDLLAAAEKVIARWERGDLAEAVRELAGAIAKAREGAG
jgi:hypothetical protein